MELEDTLTLAAASLLGKSVFTQHEPAGNISYGPTLEEITVAVRTAHEIWKETLRQQREG